MSKWSGWVLVSTLVLHGCSDLKGFPIVKEIKNEVSFETRKAPSEGRLVFRSTTQSIKVFTRTGERFSSRTNQTLGQYDVQETSLGAKDWRPTKVEIPQMDSEAAILGTTSMANLGLFNFALLTGRGNLGWSYEDPSTSNGPVKFWVTTLVKNIEPLPLDQNLSLIEPAVLGAEGVALSYREGNNVTVLHSKRLRDDWDTSKISLEFADPRFEVDKGENDATLDADHLFLTGVGRAGQSGEQQAFVANLSLLADKATTHILPGKAARATKLLDTGQTLFLFSQHGSDSDSAPKTYFLIHSSNDKGGSWTGLGRIPLSRAAKAFDVSHFDSKWMLSYVDLEGKLFVRLSPDRGASWTSPTQLGDKVENHFCCFAAETPVVFSNYRGGVSQISVGAKPGI